MSATVTPLLRGSRFRVTCAEHGLDRTVNTEEHAENLRAIHQRKDHPGERPTPEVKVPAYDPEQPAQLNLLAAAEWLLLVIDDPGLGESHGLAALSMWTRLTGLHEGDALAYARRITAAGTPVTAHIAPF